MKDLVYKLIELTGTSTKSIQDAVKRAIKRAHKTIKNWCWFQVVETRGNTENGKVHHQPPTKTQGFKYLLWGNGFLRATKRIQTRVIQ
jgi:flavin-binding protein dodecin